MFLSNGQTHQTIGDAAKKFGVAAKTVRDWIQKGIIPPPPKVKRGIQMIQIFPDSYLKTAEEHINEHIASKNRKGVKK